MTIEISLSPEENSDWLARAASGESVDIWEQMEDAERKRRAKDAHVEALADQLATMDMGTEVAERVAKTFIEYLDETEYREIRRAALTDDSAGDYLDRLTTQFVQRLREYLHATQQAQEARTIPGYIQVSDTPSGCEPAHAPVAAYAPTHPEGLTPQKPVVEITDQVEHQTADYSTDAPDTVPFER